MKTFAAVVLASQGIGQAVYLRSTNASRPTCNLFQCPDGLMPKVDHHELTGESAEECCDETCGYWVKNTGCGGGYNKNEAYYSNVGQSSQMCCDKQCGDFQCKSKYEPRSSETSGASHDACCQKTCALHSCSGIWATDSSKLHLVGETDEDCCLPTCAQFECQNASILWFKDPDKKDVVASDAESCCMPQCKHPEQIVCGDGYRVPPSKENDTTTEGEAYCCDMTCNAYNCSAGWLKNETKLYDFGSSDAECCEEQCSRFTCNLADGWANDSALDEVVGKTSEVCCKATCKQHTCDIEQNWLAQGNTKENVTGNSSEVCCEKSCLAYTCSEGMSHFPMAKETIGASDATCCEDSRCSKFRENMTQMGDKDFCNKYDKDACESHYFSMNSTIAPCQWDSTYNLCRYDTVDAVRGCYEL